ncbi:MAG: hypothetical protein AAGN66_30105 [Acidobacteriota bacterium]
MTRDRLKAIAADALGKISEDRRGPSGEFIFLRESFWSSAHGISFELQELEEDETLIRVRHAHPAADFIWVVFPALLATLVAVALLASVQIAAFLTAAILVTWTPTFLVQGNIHLRRVRAAMRALEEATTEGSKKSLRSEVERIRFE